MVDATDTDARLARIATENVHGPRKPMDNFPGYAEMAGYEVMQNALIIGSDTQSFSFM